MMADWSKTGRNLRLTQTGESPKNTDFFPGTGTLANAYASLGTGLTLWVRFPEVSA